MVDLVEKFRLELLGLLSVVFLFVHVHSHQNGIQQSDAIINSEDGRRLCSIESPFQVLQQKVNFALRDNHIRKLLKI